MSTEPHIVRLDAPGKFQSPGAVHVYAKDGAPFYQFTKGSPFEFTLPAGTYVVAGGSLMQKNLKRKGPRTDLSKLRFPMPKTVRLVFVNETPTQSIACIDPVKGIVYCVPWLKNLPHFCLVFVLLHEVGHYFYKDERSCDRFAAEEMHARGYNPSQIEMASRFTLQNKQRHGLTYAYCTTL